MNRFFKTQINPHVVHKKSDASIVKDSRSSVQNILKQKYW